MTTELEKTFFDTFKIEYCGCESPEAQLRYKCGLSYPIKKQCYKITDRTLLKLICLCSQYGFCPTARNIEDLKLNVLKRLLKLKKNLKNNYEHQGCHNAFTRKVQAIFKGER